MSINSEFIVTAFIKETRKRFLDTYLIRRGDSFSGEIFLKLNNLNGLSKIYDNNQYSVYKLGDSQK